METKKETKKVTKKGKIIPCLTEIVNGTSIYIDDLYVNLHGYYSPIERCVVVTAVIFPSYSLKDVVSHDEYELRLTSKYVSNCISVVDALCLVGNTLLECFPTDSIDVSCDGYHEVLNFKK